MTHKYLLTLSDKEYEVLQSLAKQQELDTDKVLIQALRLYQTTVNPPPDPPFKIPTGKTINLREYIEDRKDKRIEELIDALDKSVELQSHYAEMLNMHDGGGRIVFEDTEAWLERLRQLENNAS